MLVASGVVVLTSGTATADSTTVMLAAFSSPRGGTSAVWTGQYAYVFGGVDFGVSDYLNEIVRYDPATDTLTTMAATLPNRAQWTSAVWTGQYAYVFGGWNNAGCQNQIVKYDPAADTATLMRATLPTVCEWTSAAWDGTNAYIFGGRSGAAGSNKILRYDPAADAVTTMSATLPTARWATSAAWDGSSAYIFGGSDAGGKLTQILRYHPATDTVTAMAGTFASGRDLTSAAWGAPSIYVFGGNLAAGRTSQIVRYDPSTDTVTTMAATLPTARAGTSAVWTGADAYVFGGYEGTSDYNGAVTEIVRYAPDAPPSAPENPRVSAPAYGQLRVEWDPPASNGGTSITTYRVYHGTPPLSAYADVPASQSWFVESDLLPGPRSYQVSAINGAGFEGPRSAIVEERAFAEYTVELRAWIPHAIVIDPIPESANRFYWNVRAADSMAGSAPCHGDQWDLLTPFTAMGFFEGDGHAGYEGTTRVKSVLHFKWDGALIFDAYDAGSAYGETVQHRVYADFSNVEICELARATADEPIDALAPTPTSFHLHYETENPRTRQYPLGSFLTPTIDGALTGTFSPNGDLELRYLTDQFPSHALRVVRNGLTQLTIVSTDASCVDGQSMLDMRRALESEQEMDEPGEGVEIVRQTDILPPKSYASDAC